MKTSLLVCELSAHPVYILIDPCFILTCYIGGARERRLLAGVISFFY
jgi:hypothetical protein